MLSKIQHKIGKQWNKWGNGHETGSKDVLPNALLKNVTVARNNQILKYQAVKVYINQNEEYRK